MAQNNMLLILFVSAIITSFLYLWVQITHMNSTCAQISSNYITKSVWNHSWSNQIFDNLYGWRLIGADMKEQARLHKISSIVAAWSENVVDNIPIVPSLSADRHLLVLSASASRVRYGMSVTFIMVFPTDVNRVLPKTNLGQPLSPTQLKLWCIFNDGSVTSAYSYDLNYFNDRVSLVDCPLSSFASDELWRHNRTLRVYLVSTTDMDRNIPILKAFVTVPQSALVQWHSSQQLLTLCTSPLHNKAHQLAQWIEFHRLVGFQKFVVYNSTDTNGYLSSVLSSYAQKYPNLVDVVQWNFSALALTDPITTRYFQLESLHDCLIRYGDQSEWLGALDLDEYIVPLPPYKTVLDYVNENFGQRAIGSINLWSQFYCTQSTATYTGIENDTSLLAIERFTVRAPTRFKSGREKYLYRPRFVQYLSIHHQVVGLPKQEPSKNHIMLAHYGFMNNLRALPGCDRVKLVKDTSIRDRFANRVHDAVRRLLT
ncbi:unnamed protein product [Rotaria sp. Silwood1]|nr:unnamed protein product [Rotaria sp. Silwood1]